MIISIIGPSGCGKGTQAKLLAEKLGVPAISTGKLLRQEVEAGTPEGGGIKKHLSRGGWVPAEITMKVVIKRLKEKDCQKGFILDGTPRKMGDIPILEEYLSREGQSIDLILHLDTSDEICLARIQERVFKAQEAGQEVREDDSIELVKERLREYHQTIEPVLKYFEEKGILRRINNEQPIEDVSEEVSAVVEELS